MWTDWIPPLLILGIPIVLLVICARQWVPVNEVPTISRNDPNYQALLLMYPPDKPRHRRPMTMAEHEEAIEEGYESDYLGELWDLYGDGQK